MFAWKMSPRLMYSTALATAALGSAADGTSRKSPQEYSRGGGRAGRRLGWGGGVEEGPEGPGGVAYLPGLGVDRVEPAGPGSGQRDRVRVGPHEPQGLDRSQVPVELAAHQVSHCRRLCRREHRFC